MVPAADAAHAEVVARSQEARAATAPNPVSAAVHIHVPEATAHIVVDVTGYFTP
jgi:hypothetical protein